MKSIAKFATLLFALSMTAFAAPNAQESFDNLKTLAGEWQTKTSESKTATVSYRVMANGSSVVSEIDAPGDNMISVFHMDKDRLLLTHYCGAGNQPRMQASTSADGKTITFDFVDGTNILPSQMGHMKRLVVTILDANHHTEQWELATNDGKQMAETFDLVRKK
jgi:hypothetical protein